MDKAQATQNRSAATKAAMYRRWNGPRVVRLDTLPLAQRDILVALINTMKAAPAVTGTATPEVRDDSAATAS